MKQPIVAITGAFALLSLTGALGCGDDSSSGSGVNSNKLVSEVTDEDAKKVCRWVEKQSASVNPSEKQICTAGVLGLASDETSCNKLVDQCVAGTSGELPEEEASDCDTASASDVDSCDTITVGEYEACVKAQLDALKSSLSSVSCKNAGDAPDFEASTTPEACKKIERECPDLLEDTAGGETTIPGGGTGTGSTADSFACGNNEYVPKDYVCDEEVDCDNGKDEQNCP